MPNVSKKKTDLGLKHDGPIAFRAAWAAIWKWNVAVPWVQRKALDYLAPRIALVVSLVAIGGHAIWAVHTHNGVNFQRGGGVVSLTAAALYAAIDWHAPKGGALSGGLVEKLRTFNPKFLLPFLAGIGTLIWAYGDLLPWFG